MKKVEKYLNRWTEKKLISSEQRQVILEFEGRELNKKSWILYAFLILGVSVIGIGIISIVAANWEKIPPGLKLINNFIFISGCAAFTYYAYSTKRDILFDIASLFYMLLCLASIGLISQVYQTGGELYQALSFWLIITLPVALLRKRDFAPNLWIVLFIITLFLSADNGSVWRILSFDEEQTFITLIFCIPLFFLTSLTAITHFSKTRSLVKYFHFWIVVALFVITCSLDMALTETIAADTYTAFLPALCMLPIVILSLIFNKFYFIKEKIVICIILLIITIETLIMQITGSGTSDNFGEFIAPGFTILILFLLSTIFSMREYKKVFNFLILLIGLRFIIIYFQVFGDLAATGLGLIFSGIIILGVSYAWYRYNGRLFNLVRSKTK